MMFSPQGVATAISCGVDSFTTLKEYTIDCENDDYRITHLTFYENGAHHLDQYGYNEGQIKAFLGQANTAKEFCEKYGYELILIESNLNEMLSKLFWDDAYALTHTYRNVGFSLLLQKLVKTYYYSAGVNLDTFHFYVQSDPAYYERFLLPCCSTENTSFFNSNEGMTRLEKTMYISDFEQTYDHLLVCYMSGHNCGECKKCRRTLLTLDTIGKLDRYKNSFDIEKYQREKTDILADMIAYKDSDIYLNEIFQYRKEHNLEIPSRAYLLALTGKTKRFLKQCIVKTPVFPLLYPTYKKLFKKK